jgi:hypothetical protein
MDRQIELVREGRYDKAIQVNDTWMKDPQRDLSHKRLLYGQKFPLGLLRRDINKHPDAARKKSAKTSCTNANQNG